MAAEELREGSVVWRPSAGRVARSNLAAYQRWLEVERGLRFADYAKLWTWSVTDLEAFWQSIWDFWRVEAHAPYERVLADRKMPGAAWFTGARLNFAEHMLRSPRTTETAVLVRSESGAADELSWDDLRAQVASLAAALRDLGVGRGDRVVGYLPNIPETLVAFLACASIGAVWSCCSPDFGTRSVLDRFQQIEPKVMFAVDGYRYNGKPFDRLSVVQELREQLPSLRATVVVRSLESERRLAQGLVPYERLLANGSSRPEFEPVGFDHPLWILYSSGTTGPPKAIAQGHGGVLLGLLAALGFHYDLQPDDRYFWFTTSAWAVWNVTVAGLLFGSTVVLYDGSASYPDIDCIWELTEETELSFLGVGTALALTWMRAGIEPGLRHDLRRLETLAVTGAPMPASGFQWVYEHISPDVWFFSISGGTDSIVPLVAGALSLPVTAGEIQCRCLGAKVEAYDESGRPLIDEVGELVITEPLPSMPLFLWDDRDGVRYHESYFTTYPGVWRHGDWIKITSRGTAIIYGRSDATLKRGGVRIGTAEIYTIVEALPEIADSLVVDMGGLDRESLIVLFVQTGAGVELDDSLEQRIVQALRDDASPRHVPDAIIAAPEIPRTLNNKKMEVPVKRILMGVNVDATASRDSMSNPTSLDFFLELAPKLGTTSES